MTIERVHVVCDACGWETRNLDKQKAYTRVCPHCKLCALKPY
jgi:predicted Zn-ribbon and HTH transcriptional regulator